MWKYSNSNIRIKLFFKKKWEWGGSNSQRNALQAFALPFELHPHIIELSVRFELTCPFGTRLQGSYNRPLCEESLFVLSLRFELKLQQSKCCVLTSYTN